MRPCVHCWFVVLFLLRPVVLFFPLYVFGMLHLLCICCVLYLRWRRILQVYRRCIINASITLRHLAGRDAIKESCIVFECMCERGCECVQLVYSLASMRPAYRHLAHVQCWLLIPRHSRCYLLTLAAVLLPHCSVSPPMYTTCRPSKVLA